MEINDAGNVLLAGSEAGRKAQGMAGLLRHQQPRRISGHTGSLSASHTEVLDKLGYGPKMLVLPASAESCAAGFKFGSDLEEVGSIPGVHQRERGETQGAPVSRGGCLPHQHTRGERMRWEGQALQQQRAKSQVKFSATAMQEGSVTTSTLPEAGWDPTAWLIPLTVPSGRAKDGTARHKMSKTMSSCRLRKD